MLHLCGTCLTIGAGDIFEANQKRRYQKHKGGLTDMPTYVYTCDACGVQFEQFQSFKDAPLQDCPRCTNNTVRRVFQPVGVVFKGSGWYITDSRNSNGKTGKSDSGKAANEPKSSEQKSSNSSTTTAES
jgi:putative FmdB family regulatory protein